jgi:hypothetical protein
VCVHLNSRGIDSRHLVVRIVAARPIVPNTDDDGSDNPEGWARNRGTKPMSRTDDSVIAKGSLAPDFFSDGGVLRPDSLLNGPVCRLIFVLLRSGRFVMFWLTSQFLRA